MSHLTLVWSVPKRKSTVRGMDKRALLEKQDWNRITRQLTGFAWRWMGKHKTEQAWDDARKVAQKAIARAFERSWRTPLISAPS